MVTVDCVFGRRNRPINATITKCQVKEQSHCVVRERKKSLVDGGQKIDSDLQEENILLWSETGQDSATRVNELKTTRTRAKVLAGH